MTRIFRRSARSTTSRKARAEQRGNRLVRRVRFLVAAAVGGVLVYRQRQHEQLVAGHLHERDAAVRAALLARDDDLRQVLDEWTGAQNKLMQTVLNSVISPEAHAIADAVRTRA